MQFKDIKERIELVQSFVFTRTIYKTLERERNKNPTNHHLCYESTFSLWFQFFWLHWSKSTIPIKTCTIRYLKWHCHKQIRRDGIRTKWCSLTTRLSVQRRMLYFPQENVFGLQKSNQCNWPKALREIFQYQEIRHSLFICFAHSPTLEPSKESSKKYERGYRSNGIQWPRKICERN